MATTPPKGMPAYAVSNKAAEEASKAEAIKLAAVKAAQAKMTPAPSATIKPTTAPAPMATPKPAVSQNIAIPPKPNASPVATPAPTPTVKASAPPIQGAPRIPSGMPAAAISNQAAALNSQKNAYDTAAADAKAKADSLQSTFKQAVAPQTDAIIRQMSSAQTSETPEQKKARLMQDGSVMARAKTMTPEQQQQAWGMVLYNAPASAMDLQRTSFLTPNFQLSSPQSNMPPQATLAGQSQLASDFANRMAGAGMTPAEMATAKSAIPDYAGTVGQQVQYSQKNFETPITQAVGQPPTPAAMSTNTLYNPNVPDYAGNTAQQVQYSQKVGASPELPPTYSTPSSSAVSVPPTFDTFVKAAQSTAGQPTNVGMTPDEMERAKSLVPPYAGTTGEQIQYSQKVGTAQPATTPTSLTTTNPYASGNVGAIQDYTASNVAPMTEDERKKAFVDAVQNRAEEIKQNMGSYVIPPSSTSILNQAIQDVTNSGQLAQDRVTATSLPNTVAQQQQVAPPVRETATPSAELPMGATLGEQAKPSVTMGGQTQQQQQQQPTTTTTTTTTTPTQDTGKGSGYAASQVNRALQAAKEGNADLLDKLMADAKKNGFADDMMASLDSFYGVKPATPATPAEAPVVKKPEDIKAEKPVVDGGGGTVGEGQPPQGGGGNAGTGTGYPKGSVNDVLGIDSALGKDKAPTMGIPPAEKPAEGEDTSFMQQARKMIEDRDKASMASLDTQAKSALESRDFSTKQQEQAFKESIRNIKNENFLLGQKMMQSMAGRGMLNSGIFADAMVRNDMSAQQKLNDLSVKQQNYIDKFKTTYDTAMKKINDAKNKITSAQPADIKKAYNDLVKAQTDVQKMANDKQKDDFNMALDAYKTMANLGYNSPELFVDMITKIRPDLTPQRAYDLYNRAQDRLTLGGEKIAAGTSKTLSELSGGYVVSHDGQYVVDKQGHPLLTLQGQKFVFDKNVAKQKLNLEYEAAKQRWAQIAVSKQNASTQYDAMLARNTQFNANNAVKLGNLQFKPLQEENDLLLADIKDITTTMSKLPDGSPLLADFRKKYDDAMAKVDANISVMADTVEHVKNNQ